MGSRKTVPGVRRALTTHELDQILSRIQETTSAEQLQHVTVAGLYDTLLADSGQSLASLPADLAVNPSEFAIPTTQWEAITATALNHANQWGAGPRIALGLINWAPSYYHDPTVAIPTLNLPERRPEHLGLHVARAATDTIADCQQHVAALGDYYGTDSPIYRQAAETLLQHVCRLFSMGFGATTQVHTDGLTRLSLFVVTGSGFVYGIIFHPQRRRCTTKDCGAFIDDDGTVHARGATPADGHEHVPSYPLDAPTPGTWSVHS